MKILLITTGGTIASSKGEEGLTPTIPGEELASKVPGLTECAEFDILNVFSIDSSNMHPDNWLSILRVLDENKDKYDGFVISHGTDTMSYTASALSFVLRNFSKPVVLTGSMIPIDEPETDAKKNMLDSFLYTRALAEKGQAGVSICFHGKLIHGPRSKKMSGKTNNAFHSIYYEDIGKIENSKAVILKKPFIDKVTLPGQKDTRFSKNILPVKLFPGFSASYLDKMLDLNPSAVVIECFGLGGLPHAGENLLPAVQKAVSRGIVTVITTQCPEGGVDLSTYDVGQKSLKIGALSALDMGYEAIITKLMWLLPQTSFDQVGDYLPHNFCDEVGRH